MKICLIGSTRFMDLYRDINRQLTLAGHLVYTVATISTSVAGEEAKAEAQGITDDQKEILDLVHLRKVQESEAVVLVTDATGYVGYSTRRELRWSRMNVKTIYDCRNESDMAYLVDSIHALNSSPSSEFSDL